MQSGMELWIAQNPAFVKLIGVGGVMLIIYLYKRGENKSARLIASEMSKLSGAITELVADGKSVRRWVGRLQRQVDSQCSKCEERGLHCPVVMGSPRTKQVLCTSIPTEFQDEFSFERNE